MMTLLATALLAATARADAPATAAELGLMVGSPPPPDKQVTAENFIAPPWNRWSFQHVRELFPTRAVRPAASPRPLPSRPLALDQLEVDLGQGRRATVGDWLESAYTDGFIVLDRGTVVHEQYGNGQQPATPHLMFSVTKSVTGIVMLMLMERGDVNASDTVSSLVPELGGTAFGDATVQQIMDMTNAISYDETYDDPDSDIGAFIAATLPGGEGLYAHLQSLTEKHADFAHGEAFHYVTPDPEVLAWIIRRVTGRQLADVVHDMLWSPLGSAYEANYWLDPLGVEMAGGGMSMTLRDAARLGQLVLDDGRVGDTQVLSTAIARRIKTSRNQARFSRFYDDAWYGEVAESYHDQWWSYAGVDAVAALGIHGQFIYVNSDHDVVIVKQSSDPEAENYRVDSETPRVMHAIAAFVAANR